jgi:NAD(P)-dependent dehydrogenase (short-subunit alcohol dehydrogenase family)
MCFKHKNVLITGAGCNTGLGIAAGFAAKGAVVFLNDKTVDSTRRGVDQLRRLGLKKVFEAPADIGVPAEVESMFSQIQSKVKCLDVLANNAVHQGMGFTFLDTSFEYFESVVRVNLLGTFYVSQQAVRLMIRNGRGAIVNIGSNVTTRAIHKRSAYIASKGGVDALTLAMAVDLAPHHIRVNNVAPGYIRTDRWKTLSKEHIRRRRDNIPLAKEVSPDDIAEAVLFLASDAAANITGTRLVVDGGCVAQHMPSDIDV